MARVIVACPKCQKRQEVGGVIPDEGLRYSCTSCSAAFMVKLPSSGPRRKITHGDLPAPREQVPRPAPAPPPSSMPGIDLGPPADLGLDLMTNGAPGLPSELPRGGSPLAPLELDLPGASAPPPGLDLSLSLSAEPPGLDLPLPAPPGLDLSLGDLGGDAAPSLPPLSLDPGPEPSLGLDLVDEPTTQTPSIPAPAADVGFSLELDGGAPAEAPAQKASAPRPVPKVAAKEKDAVPALAPPARERRAAAVKKPTTAAKRRLPLGVLIGAGVTMAAVAGGVFVVPLIKSEPKPVDVLGGIAAELARDDFPAYQRAADQLTDALTARPDARLVRAAAAETLLLSVLARGAERSRIGRAEGLINEIPANADPSAELRRARALLAIARGKAKDAVGLLGPEAASAEGKLIDGLARLHDGKAAAAISSFEAYATAAPDRVVGRYLLARALEDAGRPQAKKAYDDVLAKNAQHFGAQVARARFTAEPKDRMEAAAALLGKPGGSKGEVAEAHVVRGRAAQELGRTSDATGAFEKAVAVDAQSVPANLALGEALMFEGRAEQALARFRAAGPAALRSAQGKFGLGGALVANGKIDEGMALVRQAMAEKPDDPRGHHFVALAAEMKTPPNVDAAVEGYRAALARDKRYVPSSLRLAALLQRQGKAQDALSVLRAAEDAGAPPTALQLAWGEALTAAKEPARAEEVFRKALAATPELTAARVGLASALEAQGNVGGAKDELEKALAATPKARAVRERLAELYLKVGQKDDALAQYKAAVADGNSTPELRVALAKVAIEVGKVDEAEAELQKVIDENPGVPDALFVMGRVHEARGDSARAIQEYRRALVWGSTPALHLAYGRALLRMGKEQDAFAAFDAAATLPDARVERGKLLFKRTELEKAAAEFAEASKLAPDSVEPYLWQGLCFDKMGQRDRAADAWNAAVRVAPAAPEPHYHLGRQHMDRDRPAAALDHLRKAAATTPEKAWWRPELYFQLGFAELSAGSKPAAKTALAKYLELAPPDAPARPEVEKQMQRLASR